MILIFKSNGQSQDYDESKLQKSIIKACLSSGRPKGESEEISQRVISELTPWLETKTEITSAELRLKAAEILENFNQDSAYIYKNYKKII